MANEVTVILDLSDEVQIFLEQQRIDLYEELQREEPSLRFEIQPDPDAPAGSRDVTTVILAISTLVGSLTPLLIRILNQFTPPNRSGHWEIEEVETRHPDGTVVVHRKRVRSSEEQRPWTALPSPDPQFPTQAGQTSIPQQAKDRQQ
jgi:hypothetical protein